MAIYNFLGGQLPKAREYLGGYEEFISKNASAVSQIESGLRSLTYIIPGGWQRSSMSTLSSWPG
jgi:peroxin-16